MRKPKNLIFDRNVNLAQGKIIMDKQAEKKHLDQCKAKVDQVLVQFNVDQLPMVQLVGNQLSTNILYVIRQPPPADSKIN